MDFKVSYEQFIQNVKYQLIRIEKNIEKEVSEWEIKLAPSDRVSVKANVLDSKGTTFKDHECKLESKIVEFEQRVVKLEKEKDRMKLDILNLKQEKSVLSNKLNHFQELKLFEHRLNKTLERKIRNKTDLKAQVSNNLQEIGRLEKQLKNEKNFHSAIEKEKKSLERKIEELQRQTTESNKANPQNLKPLKAKKMMKKKKANQENIYKCKSRLKESKTKLKYADRENSQLAEKNFLLVESNRKTSEEIKKLRTSFQVVEDALKQEKKKTQEVITLLQKWKEKFHELEEKIQTTVQNQAAYEFPMVTAIQCIPEFHGKSEELQPLMQIDYFSNAFPENADQQPLLNVVYTKLKGEALMRLHDIQGDTWVNVKQNLKNGFQLQKCIGAIIKEIETLKQSSHESYNEYKIHAKELYRFVSALPEHGNESYANTVLRKHFLAGLRSRALALTGKSQRDKTFPKLLDWLQKEIDEEEELREIHNRLQSTRMRTSQQQQSNYNRSTQANNYNYNRNNKNNRRGNNNDYREQRNNYRGNNNNYRGNKSNYRRNNINFGKNYNNYQGTRNFDNNNGYNNNNNSNPNENYRENNRNGGYYKNNNNNYRRHKDNQNS
ncbi:myb-like protein G [Toxorhynchites rutilus septentrionalis]|uniref:myb-like protein G n=1 Tax=Toxorhynchites rutilus septentrionalis TaxID=329112 RepID=UPI00247A2265|nr:myb-like protein G [Toxorhynchites rutilus septentrionalis]